ncbi:hypothetical protein ABK040_001543 [Willaertia magna]
MIRNTKLIKTFAFKTNPAVFSSFSKTTLRTYATESSSRIHEVDYASVKDKLCQAQVIDVRSTQEYENSQVKIKSCCNLPVNTIEENGKLLDPTKPIYVLCQSGVRAKRAADILANKYDAKEIYVIKGGMNSVQSCVTCSDNIVELKKDAGSKVWAMERQVRFTAGSLVLAGVVGSMFSPYAILLSGGIGAGLMFSAITNTCGMAVMLNKMPWNKVVKK